MSLQYSFYFSITFTLIAEVYDLVSMDFLFQSCHACLSLKAAKLCLELM